MTQGIHHITAVASDAQKTFNFYTNILGLRLVKKTVNQDDVRTYHLFFGDKLGYPGMDLTFFIFRTSIVGKTGNGFVSKISFSVPEGSFSFWEDRLEKFGVKYLKPTRISGNKRLEFFDSDNMHLEIVGVTGSELGEDSSVWETNEISKEQAIRNFYSATLNVSELGFIDPILKYVFNYEQVHKEDNTYTYKIKNSQRAGILEVHAEKSMEVGQMGSGTVHHIAFRAKDEKAQLAHSRQVLELGLQPTHVIDRFYFKSVYFRTPAGILFEIATDGPGFTADESEIELGGKLALPPFLEHNRKLIEDNLPLISLD